MSISTFSQSRVLVPFIAIPCPARKHRGSHFCAQLRLPRSAASVYLQSGEFCKACRLENVRERDTKSESLEYMGREEGTASLMQEHGADYVAADRMKGRGLPPPGTSFTYTSLPAPTNGYRNPKPGSKVGFAV
jgi:hypothetical protein